MEADGDTDAPARSSGPAPQESGRPVVAVSGTGSHPDVIAAIERGGGLVGPVGSAEALVHVGSVEALPSLTDRIRWVQLSSAGVETYLRSGRLDRRRVWSSAAGVYAATVAEHAVAQLLAGVRGLVASARLTSWQPGAVEPRVTGLAATTVAIVGAGGIGRRAMKLLAAFGAATIAINRSGAAVPGAIRTLPADRAGEVWSEVDHVILAAPATDATRGLIDAAVLASMKPTTWIVNVARGSLIDTDALIDAVAKGQIAGAVLDVTDPEPLPDGHPLWTTPGVLITPHTANPAAQLRPAFNDRVEENVARFAAGRELLGVIDLDAGY